MKRQYDIYGKGLRRRFKRENTRNEASVSPRARLCVWLALRWRRLPVFMAGLLGGFVSVPALVAGPSSRGGDRLPRRVGLRRIRGNAWDGESGGYRYGTMPLTVGKRFGALQAIQEGDALFEPLRLYFGLRRLEVLFTPLGKVVRLVRHIRMDEEARTERDRRTVVPMTDMQRQAGIGMMNHGLFGVIDFVATRNHLTYKEVYELSDTQLYGILQIEHDRAMAQRQLEAVARQRQERDAAVRRARSAR